VRTYTKGLLLFRKSVSAQGIELQHVTPVGVRNWRDALKTSYAPQTVNLWLSSVRSFYGWLVERGVLPISPAASVKGVTRRGGSTRHKRDELTSTEVSAVLDTCEDDEPGRRDRALLSLMAYCALRSIEVFRADMTDLQTKDGRTVLWVHGKGHSEADDFVVLPIPAEVAVQGWLAVRGQDPGALFTSMSNQSRGERLALRSIRWMVKRRYQAAGVVNGSKTTHSLRHSAITSAIRNGATPMQTQAMARHKSFDTTLNYYHEVGRTQNPAEDLISYG
jgi:integrase/recombinase XerD